MKAGRLRPLPALLTAALLAALPAVADPLRAAYSRPPQDWPPAQVDPDVAFVELGPFLPPPLPPEARAEAALGAALFAEPRLSADGRTACATCHDPAAAWSDGAPAALGRRAAPSLVASAHRQGRARGWDGRHATLAAQIEAPLDRPDEMGPGGPAAALARLKADPAWAARLGPRPTPEDLLRPLAAFLQILDTPTRFDRFAAGDPAALTDREIRGLHLFRTSAGCANCHFGPLLTDDRFHNLGLADYGEPRADPGRAAVTGRPEDWGRFRTPSLRHVARSAPYMHAGLFPSLETVVAFYARGGGEVRLRDADEAADPLRRQAADLSPHLRPRALSPEDRAALATFLRAL